MDWRFSPSSSFLILFIILSFVGRRIAFRTRNGWTTQNRYEARRSPNPGNGNVRSCVEKRSRSLRDKSFRTCVLRFSKILRAARNLEFDGYCEKFRIAFEHHGEQHYNYPNRWHKKRDEFVQQVRRDGTRRTGVIKNQITLDHHPLHDRIGSDQTIHSREN